MVFNASVSTRGMTAVIKLDGDLDEVNANDFIKKVDTVVEDGASRIVLDMTRLEQLSSAGLRGLIFAAEKLPDGAELVVVSPNRVVREVIDGVDFEQSVTMADAVPD
jgi:anti-anti-sigma factor